MKIKRLKLKNFKKHRDLELHFDSGLIGISGRNGSGKSTIFDAILFALYGLANGVTIPELANSKDKRGVLVELDFLVENQEYRVVRELAGKSLTQQADIFCGNELLATKSKQVTNKVEEIIGANAIAFKHSVFASQKELSTLTLDSKESRKESIRKLLNLNKLDKLEKIAKDKIKELEIKIDSFRGDILDIDEIEKKELELASNQKEIDKLLKQDREVEREIQNIKIEIDKLNIEIKKLEDIKDRFNQESKIKVAIESKLGEAKRRLNENISKVAELKRKEESLREFENLDRELKLNSDELKEVQEIKEQSIKQKQILNTIQKSQARSEEIEENLKLLDRELSQIEPSRELEINREIENQNSKLEDINQKIENQNERVATLKEKRSSIKNTIDKLKGLDRVCPTCQQHLGDEYHNILNRYEDDFSNIDSDYKAIETELKELKDIKSNIDLTIQKLNIERKDDEKKVKALTQKLEQKRARERELERVLNDIKGIEDSYIEIKYDNNLHNRLLDKQKELNKKRDEKIKILEAIREVGRLRDENLNIESDINRIQIELSKIEKSIKTLDYSKLEQNRSQIETLSESKETKNKNQSNIKIEINNLKNLNSNLKSTLDKSKESQSELESIKADFNDYQIVASELKSFKNLVNLQVAPIISEKSSKLIAKLTNNRYEKIRVNDDFEIEILDGAEYYNIKRFSGGEIDLISLVLRIAISQSLNMINKSKEINFLAFDEIFGSQDELRRNEILNIFCELRESYGQIFLISHIEDVNEKLERVIKL